MSLICRLFLPTLVIPSVADALAASALGLNQMDFEERIEHSRLVRFLSYGHATGRVKKVRVTPLSKRHPVRLWYPVRI